MEAPPTSTVPSVEAAVAVEWFQLRAELVQVQVQVHQPSVPAPVEIRSNLVKSFAAGLRNPEECEDEEEEKQCCEDQEHVWPTKVLRMETFQLEQGSQTRFNSISRSLCPRFCLSVGFSGRNPAINEGPLC